MSLRGQCLKKDIVEGEGESRAWKKSVAVRGSSTCKVGSVSACSGSNKELSLATSE